MIQFGKVSNEMHDEIVVMLDDHSDDGNGPDNSPIRISVYDNDSGRARCHPQRGDRGTAKGSTGPMTAHEHHLEAERLVARALEVTDRDLAYRLVTAANTHALLALSEPEENAA
jgi:hypothetical protein